MMIKENLKTESKYKTGVLFNLCGSYNRKENLEHLVGYELQIPMELADKAGVYYQIQNENIFPLICVEKVRNDKLFPVSIIHGDIKYSNQNLRLGILQRDCDTGIVHTEAETASCDSKYMKSHNLYWKSISENDPYYDELMDFAQEMVTMYEEIYGEYHEESATKEIDCMLDLPVFQKAEEPLEEDLDNDYEEELE